MLPAWVLSLVWHDHVINEFSAPYLHNINGRRDLHDKITLWEDQVHVPQDQMSPQTCGPRTSFPPGRVVLETHVPCQDKMSPPPPLPLRTSAIEVGCRA